MLSNDDIREIKRLRLDEGLGYTEIAKQRGVSRETVGRVLSGKRQENEPKPLRIVLPEDEEEDVPRGPLVRCPGCGGLVSMPCRLCRVRGLVVRERVSL